jgi:hypothetical protein
MRVMLAASNLGCNGAVVYARRLAPLLIERGRQRLYENYLPAPHLAALEFIYEELVGAA